MKPAYRPLVLPISCAVAILGMPVPAAFATPPTIPTFTASVSDLNLVTLRWRTVGGYDDKPYRVVYIYGPRLYPGEGWSPVVRDDVAFQPQSLGSSAVSTSFRADPGHHTYTLEVKSNAGETATRSVAVDIAAPRPPLTPFSTLRMNPFAPKNVAISWTIDKVRGAKDRVKIVPPPSLGLGTIDPATSPYIVTPRQLPGGDLRSTYQLVACRNNHDAHVNFQELCSEPTNVVVDRSGAKFAWKRQQTAMGTSPTVTWSGPGNVYLVESSDLTLDDDSTPNSTWVAGRSLTIPDPAAGLHELTLTTCNLVPGSSVTCAEHEERAPIAGTVTQLLSPGTIVTAGQVIARVTSDATSKDVVATTAGKITVLTAPDGSSVAAYAPVARVTSSTSMTLDVGTPATWTEVPWAQAFAPLGRGTVATNVTPVAPTAGLPLDLSFTASQGLWSIGEFFSSVSQVRNGALTDRDIPLLRKVIGTPHGWIKRKVTPFANPLDAARSSDVSALAERVVEGASGQIWFTQGGASDSSNDHSRIVRFDSFGIDDPSTFIDERFCAYAVPGTQNHVYGIAWDGSRIWFAEERWPSSGATSISTFDPATTPCNTLLDYGDQSALDALAYCTTPFAAGCITNIPFPAPASGLTQIAVDPSPPGGTATRLWITELKGSAIDRLDLSISNSVTTTRYPLPSSVGGTPWRVVADADYVYFSDFTNAQLIRLVKSPTCEPDENGVVSTSCFSSLRPPLRASAVMNAIILHDGRLHFALDSGQIGYVDTATWRDGVLYTGMVDVVDRPRRDVAPPEYNGIDLDDRGNIAVSDFHRKQVVVLRPKPRRRPAVRGQTPTKAHADSPRPRVRSSASNWEYRVTVTADGKFTHP